MAAETRGERRGLVAAAHRSAFYSFYSLSDTSARRAAPTPIENTGRRPKQEEALDSKMLRVAVQRARANLGAAAARSSRPAGARAGPARR